MNESFTVVVDLNHDSDFVETYTLSRAWLYMKVHEVGIMGSPG